jgi:TatD DNase family protein
MPELELFDTHAHTHEMIKRTTPVYDKWREDGTTRTPEQVIADARAVGVNRMLCVGTTLEDSRLAIELANQYDGLWASIGIHPHESSQHKGTDSKQAFAALVTEPKVVAVGECGLDYFYTHSSREDQIDLLKFQIELALEHDLPLSFHVREAYDDFWPLFESYRGAGLRGVLHSFTDSLANLERAASHGLYIGVNGIATFAKRTEQITMYKSISPELLMLETDAPFLTPAPFRGKVCESKHVRVTAEFLASLRGVSLEELAVTTTANARTLFKV